MPSNILVSPDSAVEKFYSWHFNPRNKSFEQLQIPHKVRLLELLWANPARLSELPELPFLEELQIHRCRNLCSPSRLPRLAPKLRKLIVTTCGKLSNVELAVRHPALELAIVNGTRIRG